MSTDLVFFTVLFAFLVLEEYKPYHAENEKRSTKKGDYRHHDCLDVVFTGLTCAIGTG